LCFLSAMRSSASSRPTAPSSTFHRAVLFRELRRLIAGAFAEDDQVRQRGSSSRSQLIDYAAASSSTDSN
jgi:hypothetical protein